jgi:hypothetical protein
MRSIVFTTALTATILLFHAGTSTADEPVACTVLTQTQLGAATGAAMGAGSPIARPGTCQWFGTGKIVTLTINQPRAGKSPVDQFNDGKKSLPGITVEPVSGVGDDSYYVFFAGSNRAGLGILVKKGTSVFEIRVYGFDLDKAKPVAKTLAQNAATKF